MTADIVLKLRDGYPCLEGSSDNTCKVRNAASGCLCAKAADEIDRLRAALEKIASNPQQRSNCFCGACIQARSARAALEDRT